MMSDRIGDRLRIRVVAFGRPADDRHVRIGGEAGTRANAQVGIVSAASAIAKLREEQADDGGRERGVLRRPAGHRVDLAAEKLVLDVARRLEREVFGVRVMDVRASCALSQMAVEPPHQPPRDVALVFLLRDAVAFVGIDDELRFDAEGFERVPELEGLRRGTFAVALADQRPASASSRS